MNYSYLIAILFLSLNLTAAKLTIYGRVVDANSGLPLHGATIKLKESAKFLTTNKKGEFTIEPTSSTLQVEISFIGYQTKNVTLNASSETIEISLQYEIQSLPEVSVEASSITGGSQSIGNIPGSATFISPKELTKFGYADPMRALKKVVGINIQEEDGFGLRPNIGMRGTGVERSAKVTIMEDGILMAPAPYAAPAAYFFPEFGRMESVEVLKGSSQIKYGPYTNGGVINFISKPIPSGIGAQLRFDAANNNTILWNATAGYSNDYFGFSLEGFGRSSDGFKQLDNGGNTGFVKQNWVAKAMGKFNTGNVQHMVNIKLGITEENSNETYLGLTDDDFKTTPFRRYSGSQKDNMLAEHRLSSISYTAIFSQNFDFNVTGYMNTFNRNWYKLDKVTDDNGVTTSISNILTQPNAFANAYEILKGVTSQDKDALHVKANNRSYASNGVQTQFRWFLENENFSHRIEIGIRYHQDEMDRFQWVDDYAMVDGTMMMNTAGIPGTESNRIESATAVATFIQYKFNYNKLTVIPGLRNENISFKRDDFGKNDPNRMGDALLTRENNVNVWIPGIGVHYALNANINAFFGIHKGFSPPGSKEGTLPEESINYELGTKFNNGRFNAEGILFLNDYSNLLGVDFNAGGGDGSNDLFNAGEARTYGLEALAIYDILPATSNFSLPIGITYTYTIGQFLTDFESTYEPWENVSSGDYMPYLPPHQLGLSASLEHNRFAVNIAGKYTAEMRTVAGQEKVEFVQSVPQNFIVDLSVQFVLNQQIMIYGGIKNVMNETYIVSRRPAGIRPGLPRWFNLGARFYL